MSDDNKALTTYDPQFDIKIELDKPAEPANVSEAQAELERRARRDYYSIEWSSFGPLSIPWRKKTKKNV